MDTEPFVTWRLPPTVTTRPDRVGPYRIERELGRGGMGVVYLAQHQLLGRRVALKVMRHAELIDVERFLVEARAVARFDHPNIVGIHQVGCCEGVWFLALELVEGESLIQIVRRAGPVGSLEAARIIEKLARAVHYAHEQGVLHRDLKPGNVLMNREQEPLLLDFGLAKDLRGVHELTRQGDVLGTPVYMAPEQARGDLERVSERTDVYGLGATLYELLTQRPPHQRLPDDDQAPEPPARINPEVAPALEAICLKCLESDPADRYRSAAALARDLRRYSRGAEVRAPAPHRVQPLRRTTVWAISAVTLVLGMGAAFLTVLVPQSPAPPLRADGDAPALHQEPEAAEAVTLVPGAPRLEERAAAADQPVAGGDQKRAGRPPRPWRERDRPPSPPQKPGPGRAAASHDNQPSASSSSRESSGSGASAPYASGPQAIVAQGTIAWFGPIEEKDSESKEQVREEQAEDPNDSEEMDPATDPVSDPEPTPETEVLLQRTEETPPEPDTEPAPDQPFDDYLQALQAERDAQGYLWDSFYQANTAAEGYVSVLTQPVASELVVGHFPAQVDSIKSGRSAIPQATFTGRISSTTWSGAGLFAATADGTDDGKVYRRESDGSWSVVYEPDQDDVWVAQLRGTVYAVSGEKDEQAQVHVRSAQGWSRVADLDDGVPTRAVAFGGELWVALSEEGERARVFRGSGTTWTEVPKLIGGKLRDSERQAVTDMIVIRGILFVTVATWDGDDPKDGEIYALVGDKLKRVSRLRGDAPLCMAYQDGTVYVGTQAGRLHFVRKELDKKGKPKLRLVDEVDLPTNGGVHTLLPVDDRTLLIGVKGPYGAEVLRRIARSPR